VLRVMSKTAVNINQLARSANAGGDISAPQVRAAAEHMDRQVERVADMLEAVAHGNLFREGA